MPLYTAYGKKIVTEKYLKAMSEAAVEWATKLRALENVVVLDTESCGGRKEDEIISIGIARLVDGKKLFYSLLNPSKDVKFNYFATQVHGIDKRELIGQPMFKQVFAEIKPILENNIVLAYNYSADKRMIEQTANKQGIELPEIEWDCAMPRYKHYKQHLKTVTLTQACLEMNVQNGGHNALEDAIALARVIYRMEKRYGIG